jgi:hypothetical protein
MSLQNLEERRARDAPLRSIDDYIVASDWLRDGHIHTLYFSSIRRIGFAAGPKANACGWVLPVNIAQLRATPFRKSGAQTRPSLGPLRGS